MDIAENAKRLARRKSRQEPHLLLPVGVIVDENEFSAIVDVWRPVSPCVVRIYVVCDDRTLLYWPARGRAARLCLDPNIVGMVIAQACDAWGGRPDRYVSSR